MKTDEYSTIINGMTERVIDTFSLFWRVEHTCLCKLILLLITPLVNLIKKKNIGGTQIKEVSAHITTNLICGSELFLYSQFGLEIDTLYQHY